MNNISWYRLPGSGGITDMAMFASDVQPSATSKYTYSTYPACTISLLPTGLPRNGKLPVLNLLTGQKSGFSPRRGTRCTNSRQIWHGRRTPGTA